MSEDLIERRNYTVGEIASAGRVLGFDFPDSLDEAWAEAEAALGPTAWLRVEGPHDAPHDDWYDVEAVDWTDGLVAIVTLASETGPLPAALRAVVEKLREREG